MRMAKKAPNRFATPWPSGRGRGLLAAVCLALAGLPLGVTKAEEAPAARVPQRRAANPTTPPPAASFPQPVATLEVTVPIGDLVWLDARSLLVPDAVLRSPPQDASSAASAEMSATISAAVSGDMSAAVFADVSAASNGMAGAMFDGMSAAVSADTPADTPALQELGLRLYRLDDYGTPKLQRRTPIWQGRPPRASGSGFPLQVTVLANSRYIVAGVNGPHKGDTVGVILDRATLTPVGVEAGLQPLLWLPDGRLLASYQPPEATAWRGQPQPATSSLTSAAPAPALPPQHCGPQLRRRSPQRRCVDPKFRRAGARPGRVDPPCRRTRPHPWCVGPGFRYAVPGPPAQRPFSSGAQPRESRAARPRAAPGWIHT